MKRWFINFITRNLFNTLTEDDIIKYDSSKKHFVVNGQAVPDSEAREIVNGASIVQQTLVWKLLVSEMKVLANKKMYFHSKNEDDILAGKMMLYTIDIMERKLDNLSKM